MKRLWFVLFLAMAIFFGTIQASTAQEKKEIVVGMIARFQKYRRTAVFLEAVKTIVKEFQNVKILLVGLSG